METHLLSTAALTEGGSRRDWSTATTTECQLQGAELATTLRFAVEFG